LWSPLAAEAERMAGIESRGGGGTGYRRRTGPDVRRLWRPAIILRRAPLGVSSLAHSRPSREAVFGQLQTAGGNAAANAGQDGRSSLRAPPRQLHCRIVPLAKPRASRSRAPTCRLRRRAHNCVLGGTAAPAPGAEAARVLMVGLFFTAASRVDLGVANHRHNFEDWRALFHSARPRLPI